MSHAPTAPVQTDPPPREKSPLAAPAKPSRSAALLRVIRALIDIGRERLAAIRSQLNPEETHDLACDFGTFNMALIVARILRGLRIAAALEDRVIAAASRIDNPPRARAAASRPSRPRPRPKLSDAEDNAALLACVPTDREIAEMVRRRPIGAVLVDICADLGIGIEHPLWQELKWIVIDHDGQQVPVLNRTFRRTYDAYQEIVQGLATGTDFYSEPEQMHNTTGPPPLSLAA